MKMHRPHIPGLGLRSIKTGVAVILTTLLYAIPLLGSDPNPTFACIGAIFGTGSDMQDSRRSGGNRFFGTIFGGFIGLLLYWIEHLIFPDGNYWLCMPLSFVGVITLVSVCVFFQWPGGVQPGGVVLCIILFNTPARHIDYALRRMLDTGIGVLVAFWVNSRFETWLRRIPGGLHLLASDAPAEPAAAVVIEKPLTLTAADAEADEPHSPGIIILSPDISDAGDEN